MKITIDTKEDSHTEIKKVITMLSKLVEDSSPNVFEEPSSEGSNAFANMFGGSTPTSEDDTPILGEEKEEVENEKLEAEEDNVQLMEY